MKDVYLIVNADDFGLNQEVNNGIVYCFKNGIVTSASLLVNREGFYDAIIKIKKNPDLDIGVHLNIFRGRPLTGLKYLVRKNGEMAGNVLFFMFKILMSKKQAYQEIYQEFEAQIKKALENGLKISHLDTEKHIHMFPFVSEIVLDLARKYNIKAIRLPFENKWAINNPLLRQLPKLVFSKFLCRISKELFIKRGLKFPDYFYGVSLSGRYSEKNFELFIGRLKPGISELSCHPGFLPKTVLYYMDNYREEELNVLTSDIVKESLFKRGIKLSNFKIFENYHEQQ